MYATQKQDELCTILRGKGFEQASTLEYESKQTTKEDKKSEHFLYEHMCLCATHLWQPTHSTTMRMVTTKAEAAAMAPSSSTLP